MHLFQINQTNKVHKTLAVLLVLKLQTQAQGTKTSQANTTQSNKTSASIIQKYSVECKIKFLDLSKIILKLNLCRKELREYDKRFKTAITKATSSTQPSSANHTRKN